MIHSSSKITLYQNWLPYQEGTFPLMHHEDIRTICSLLVGNISFRTPTSNNEEFFESAIAAILIIDQQKMKQFETQPDDMTYWLDSLSESDSVFISYVQYLVELVKQKVVNGQYDELPYVVQCASQCQDWLKQSN